MSSSFVVYLDESGDEGFVFSDDGSGSSRWLVLSAAVIRKANDPQGQRFAAGLLSQGSADPVGQSAQDTTAFCRSQA
ncbi:DUF3800 domain-containing protein [Candidatus Thiosymbion oneisti]|uniref:DUF3800 domain-containing protein n=1 Tax=Candidatus Thiosymbion oneisti TaxID=589554 RepID=UPI001A9C6DAA|nr:DUF3800 domain-containing protein [Candidatus Thiosymbion oneisti]